MNDLISRQAAIDLLKQMRKDGDMIPWEGKDVFARIRKLPSAQPEQKTGKWINKEICLTKQKEEMQVARCSNCKKYLTTPLFYSFTNYSFCPNCGATMKGDA